MVIDVHGHVSAPSQLYAYKSLLLASRGAHGRGHLKFSDDQLKAVLNGTGGGSEGLGAHLPLLDKHGTDFQLISPRPFQMMHSEKPGRIVQWFHEEVHNVIHRHCQLYPKRFAGVCMLPQVAGEPINVALPELERCVKQLGFVGCLVKCPGTGSALDPKTNRSMDDTAHWIQDFAWLADADKKLIFEGNARKVYKLDALLDR